MNSIFSRDWSPSVASRLDAVLAATAEHPSPLAAFDFDNTLVRGDIGECFLACMARTGNLRDPAHGVLSLLAEGPRRELTALWEEGSPLLCGCLMRAYRDLESRDPAAAYTMAAAAVSGFYPEELPPLLETCLSYATLLPHAPAKAPIGDDFFSFFDTFRPMPPTVELARILAEAGARLVVVSASFAPLVRAACARVLPVAPEAVLGVELVTDREGRYLPRARHPLTLGVGKTEALNEAFPRDRHTLVLAVGDSAGDAPLLKAALHGLFLRHRVTDAALCGDLARDGVIVASLPPA